MVLYCIFANRDLSMDCGPPSDPQLSTLTIFKQMPSQFITCLKIVTNFVIKRMNYPNEVQYFYIVKICFLKVAEKSPWRFASILQLSSAVCPKIKTVIKTGICGPGKIAQEDKAFEAKADDINSISKTSHGGYKEQANPHKLLYDVHMDKEACTQFYT